MRRRSQGRDYELVPDLAKFVKKIGNSFNELAHAAGVDLKRAPRQAAGLEVIELRSGWGGNQGKRKLGKATVNRVAGCTRRPRQG
jgi:hypothetical protein